MMVGCLLAFLLLLLLSLSLYFFLPVSMHLYLSVSITSFSTKENQTNLFSEEICNLHLRSYEDKGEEDKEKQNKGSRKIKKQLSS